MSLRLAVFASGGGTNLQALIDHFEQDGDGGSAAASSGGSAGGQASSGAAEVALVISDRPDIGALERARRHGVVSRVIPVSGRPEDDVTADTLAALEDAGVEMVALAGYLRRIPVGVVERFRGRMVNIHPALLPAFGGKGLYGMRVHRAVLEAGSRISGATVHLVDEEYDRGPILAQWPAPVLSSDTPEDLAARVLRVEHRLYPAAVEAAAGALAEGRTALSVADALRFEGPLYEQIFPLSIE